MLALFTAAWIFTGGCWPPSLNAQTSYENYTFTTFAGPQESPGWYDGTNSAARFSNPYGVAVDAAGNIYVADTYNHTIRKVTPAGTVMTLAGLANVSGTNDGTGYAARFYLPMGVTVDTNGYVYVADTGNNTIRKITPAGVVTTLAGDPTQFGTNDGVGGASLFNSPAGLAVDTNGVLYVADWYNHTIRKVTPAGDVSTFAGLAQVSGTNNGTGPAARFNYPFSVAVGTNSTVYVADTSNHTIRKITPVGAVTNLAGGGSTNLFGTNNGTGSAARFNTPFGVTADTNGNVFVADTHNHTIRKVTSAGAVTTVAGMAGNFGSADGTNTAARFNSLTGVALDSAGNVFVADYNNHLIRKMTPAAVVTTYAGMGGGAGTNNGTGSAARFNTPRSVAVDGAGNVYVADASNHTIRKSTPAGAVTNLAGLATVSGAINGTGSAARFNTPYGVAADTNGNVYVADTFNHTIRKITPAGAVTTLAGSLTLSGTNDGTGAAARFQNPTSVAVGTNGILYVADTSNHTIRKITPVGANWVVSTLAGSGTHAGSADGTNTTARFNYPYGVAADTNGNVYVADSYNNMIRKITAGGAVSTLAGSADNPGIADGTGNAAQFFFPTGVGVDSVGNAFVTERFRLFTPDSGYGNHTIRKVTPAGVVTTLAGLPGEPGSANGSGVAARFSSPAGLAVAPDGTVYVADSDNHSIRKGYVAPPDMPVADFPLEKPGVTRHLDVTNLTTTSWSWSIVRYPANALAQLSSTTNRNPTFTPDLADLYVIRFQGTDSLGRLVMGMLELEGSGMVEPQISSIQMFGPNVVLTGRGGAPGATYSVLTTTNLALPMSAWTGLPGNKFDNNGGFTFTNGWSGNSRVYRLRVP